MYFIMSSTYLISYLSQKSFALIYKYPLQTIYIII